MKVRTKLMSKLMSDEIAPELKQKFLDKCEECHQNGSATLDEDDELLQFADVDSDVIVEDQMNDNEVTRVSENPEDENDLQLSAVEIPEEEPTEVPTEEPTEEPKNFSEPELLESITIERIKGEDGEKADDIVEDLKIDVEEGIEDKEKAGIFSLKFKNYSKSKAQIVAKIFSAAIDSVEKVVKDAKIDEDVQVKFDKKDEMKIMSLHYGAGAKTFSEGEDEDVTEVIDLANELAEKAENIDAENAEEIKSAAEALIEKCESCEAEGMSLKAVKTLCKGFADSAAEVLDQEPTQEPTEEPTAEPTEEPTEAPTEEVKTESEHVHQCPETKKWFVDGDETPYDTEEEANAHAAVREFSEPKVVLTIEDLEPASVSTLLNPEAKHEDEFPAEAEEEPKVNPNEGFQGRQFSMTTPKKSCNPLLFTEIN